MIDVEYIVTIAVIGGAGILAISIAGVMGIMELKKHGFIKKLKSHFIQGEHAKRRKLLEAIAKIISDEYREDNFYSRFTWLVEEMLVSDPAYQALHDKETTSGYLKKGLAQAVDEAKKRLSNG